MFGQPGRVQWQRPLDFLRQAGNGVGGDLGSSSPISASSTFPNGCRPGDKTASATFSRSRAHVGQVPAPIARCQKPVRCAPLKPRTASGSLKTRPTPGGAAASGPCASIPQNGAQVVKKRQPRGSLKTRTPVLLRPIHRPCLVARPCPVFGCCGSLHHCGRAPSARLSQSVATAHAPLRETLHAWVHTSVRKGLPCRAALAKPDSALESGHLFAAWLVQPRHDCLFLLFLFGNRQELSHEKEPSCTPQRHWRWPAHCPWRMRRARHQVPAGLAF